MKARPKKAQLRARHRKALAIIRTAPKVSEQGERYDADIDHKEALEVMRWASTT